MFPFNAPAVRSLALGSIAVILASLLGACQQQPSDSSTTDTDNVREISRLKLRLDQFERRIDEALPSSDDQGDRVPPGPIKSVTFRSGTADDRLRIYWENGQVSDLPCTLEQGTWACG